MLENIPSIEVASWSKDFLKTVVSFVTDSPHDSSVSIKDHIVYLNSYLNCLNVKTVIVEGSYVDQNYLDDYQGYYSSCFPHHPKCCARIHFFSEDFDETRFLLHLNNESEEKHKIDLNVHYLGYIVIRPIPDTFIAKLCLKVYETSLQPNYKVIKKENTVNLFGLQLTVESAPFTEKDKVVSACATSSIWMLLCSSSHFDRNSYPSPSAITKLALNGHEKDIKGFPVLGLEPEQVCRAIQLNGLEASEVILNFKNINKSFNTLKSLCVAYLTNDIPFILAGYIYKYNQESKEVKFEGKHAVCLLGYRYDKQKLSENGIQNRAEALDKVYVHDDRYGPYLALEFSNDDYQVNKNDEYREVAELPESVRGLKVFLYDNYAEKNDCELEEIFVPDRIILAKHHKARVSYEDIEKLADVFIYIMSLSSTLEDESSLSIHESSQDAIEMDTLSYEITLSNVSKLKSKTLKKPSNYFCFNNIEEKSSFLCKSLPKHIWVCSLYISNDLVGELLFDATEIIQGRPLIGYIAYKPKFNQLWLTLSKKSVSDQLEERFKKLGINENSLFKTYLKFLAESDNFIMNIRYGEPKLIYRSFKSLMNSSVDELDFLGRIKSKPNVQIQKFESEWKVSDLDIKNKYIWLIDSDGDFYYGIEKDNDSLYGGGHPTLNLGRLARVGGELQYKEDQKRWEINLSSGAYSRHINLVEDSELLLQTVLKFNFNGWNESEKPLIKK